MGEVLYVGDSAAFAASVSALVQGAGHRLFMTTFDDLDQELQRAANTAVILEFGNAQETRALIRKAREFGIPVIVLTGKPCEAFQAGEPYADLYIADPANPGEVALSIEVLLKAAPAGMDRPRSRTRAATASPE